MKLEEIKIMLDKGARMPERAYDPDAGYDLFSMESAVIPPNGSRTFNTGVHMAIPKGWFGDVRPKSGLFFKHDIVAFGTIDSGYSGAVRAKLVNLGAESLTILPGRKIAQIVFLERYAPKLVEVDHLDETERGDNGFGSTGR